MDTIIFQTHLCIDVICEEINLNTQLYTQNLEYITFAQLQKEYEILSITPSPESFDKICEENKIIVHFKCRKKL